MIVHLFSYLKKASPLWLLTLTSLWCQDKEIFIDGKVVDAHTKKPIWLASVALPSRKSGTVTDTLGLFSIATDRISKDTLVVTHLGYQELRVPLSDKMPFLEIALHETSLQLDEVQVTEYGPLYYIEQALENAYENYKQEPYNIISFVEGKIFEEGHFLSGTQSVFKSYYHQQHKEKKFEQEHQLMLYKKMESKHQLKFMRKSVMKTLKKQQSKKDSEYDPEFQMRLTPDFIAMSDGILPFLDRIYYKKFVYTLRETCSKRNLIIIDFRTKRWFPYNYVKYNGSGTIYIDCENYAIAKIDINKAELKLGFLARSTLFIILNKLKIDEAKISGRIEYKALDGVWYPHELSMYGDIKATKVNWFSKNERGDFSIQANVLVNRILNESVQEIPKEKRFSFSRLNVHNDIGIKWEDINTLSQ